MKKLIRLGKRFIKIISLVVAFILVLGCVTVGAESFSVPEVLLFGDVDMDGAVTVKDATAIQKGIAELTYLTSVQRFLCDPDKTGVSIKNTTDIQKHIAGIEASHTLFGTTVNMSKKSKFTDAVEYNYDFAGDCICVTPCADTRLSYDYTLEDFPEYEFESIKIRRFDEAGYVFYTLYLQNPSKENVLEALRALDYRANIDIESVEVNYIVYSQ